VNHRILEKERKNIPAKMKAKENGKKKKEKRKKERGCRGLISHPLWVRMTQARGALFSAGICPAS
jgi:hypothetical protein